MIIELAMPLPAIQASEDERIEGGRTITGRAVPWEVEAATATGQRVTFARGSVSMAGVPVVLHHLPERPVGVVASESDADDGLDVSARISAVRDGDEALVLAADGVLRGWSVGVNPTEFEEREDGGLYVTASEADHLALVMRPAFTDAQVTQVAASAAQPKEDAVTDTAVKTEQEAPATVAAAPRHPIMASNRLPTPGEYLLAAAQRKENPERFAALHAAVQAAAPHTLSPDVAGLSYSPLVGSLIDTLTPAARPVSDAFGILGAPSGVRTFLRPRLEATFDVADTAPEKTDVTSGPLKATNAEVRMEFIKGAGNVSAEAIAFTAMSIMAISASELVRSYLRGFDSKVTAALRAGATGDPVEIDADGSDAAKKLYVASAQIYDAVYEQPNLLIMAPDVWAQFGGFSDGVGRPLFTYAGPSNAPGTTDGIAASAAFGFNVLGLRPVVTHGLAAGEAFLAASRFFEVYESSVTEMRAEEPTILGMSIGMGGAVGTYVAEGDALVPITVAAP